MVDFTMKFGTSKLTGNIPNKNLITQLKPQVAPATPTPLIAVEQALDNPIGSPTLAEIISQKSPQKIVIVVNDVTRPTPYNYMLPPLLEQLADKGINDEQITFVIATGIHRPNSKLENETIFGSDIVNRFKFINHDSDNNLKGIGKLSDGSMLEINQEVADADLLITTGLITLHYFAGYSGGRKSILPGVAARHLITGNHARMTEPGATTGNYKTNPVHNTMLEAARLVGVDFILNVVANSQKEIVAAVAGDVEQAWLKGVAISEDFSVVTIEELADVAVVSAGGHPKDINMYQAQKALDNAQRTIRPGGTVILLAACVEGYGEDVFEEWVNDANVLQDIFTRFHDHFVLGGHKAFAIAQVLEEKNVILVSAQPQQFAENLFFSYAKDLEEALRMVQEKYGENYKAYLLPQGSLVLPQLQ